ncbi:MAG TPA: hypothetical protein QF604_22980 [Candidatus Latescibacteria bacterium]|nr:hypothetical protein [Gemmatimonadota bacterium]MDP7361608.1 hypothetical protein [Candidatus Latescibacterota bacterium]MDP7633205.1 hypothetical protein [Candidatus Latescibacterota bacterium]HJN30783.1 hypothetical protein [Candidatus Latescibacterota bacterium]
MSRLIQPPLRNRTARHRPSLLLSVLAVTLSAVVLSSAATAQTGAAFLDLGIGGRAMGMGGALSTHASGAEAIHYNPAGLAGEQGRTVQVGYQSLSLDRTHATLAGAMNLRGGLAFGLAWTHASAGPIDARTGSGELVAGGIDDTEQAIGFALGSRVNEKVLLGASLKVLSHNIDVDVHGSGESSASGRAIDIGAIIVEVIPQWRVAVGARNLLGKLSWDVRRGSAQSSASEDDLPMTPYVGVGGTWRRVRIGAEAQLYDVRGVSQARLHAGAEADLSPMLSVRGGLHRVGDADGLGLLAMGISIRPMHSNRLAFHYAWVADDLSAGGRSVLSIGGVF